MVWNRNVSRLLWIAFVFACAGTLAGLAYVAWHRQFVLVPIDTYAPIRLIDAVYPKSVDASAPPRSGRLKLAAYVLFYLCWLFDDLRQHPNHAVAHAAVVTIGTAIGCAWLVFSRTPFYDVYYEFSIRPRRRPRAERK